MSDATSNPDGPCALAPEPEAMAETACGPANRAIMAAYYLTLGVMFIASFLTEHRWWGLSWWGYFPLWLRMPAFVAAALVPLLPARVFHAVAPRFGRSDRGRLSAVAATSTVSLALFILLRTRMHLLGDGFQLLSRLVHDAPPIRPWNPAVYFLQDHVYQLLGAAGESDALLTFRLISWAAGLLFVGGVIWVTTSVSGVRGGLMTGLIIATGGQALLFFGYVENYPVFVALTALFVLGGWASLSGRISRWWAVVPLILSAFFHPFAAALAPALVYLVLHDTPPVAWYDRQSATIRVASWAAVAALTLGSAVWLQSGTSFLRFALVPWVADRFTVENYTALSTTHLADSVNLLFLLAPPLLLYLVSWFQQVGEDEAHRCTKRFLLLAAVPSLAVAFLFDPKLGMPRDWDIFAFAAVPLTLLGIHGLTTSRRAGRNLAVALALVLSILALAPRVAVEATQTKAIAVFRNLAELDPIKNRGGYYVLLKQLMESGRTDEFAELQRTLSSRYPQDSLSIRGQRLFGEGRLDEAAAVFDQMIRIDPTYASAWANLAMIMARSGRLDSAETLLRIADALNPYSPETYNRLGSVYFEQGRLDDAEQMWTRSRRIAGTSFAAVNSLLRLYAKERRRDDYVALLGETAILPGAPAGLIREFADFLAASRRYDEAEAQYRRALAAGLDTSLVRAAQQKHPSLRVLP